jgi:isopenicillin-N epimerase
VCGLINACYVEVDVPFPLSSPDAVIDCLKSAMTERTKFVLIDHVTSPTGLIFPVKEIISECHKRGIAVMVDGAHAPGMLPLDLNALDADWYTGNFHKWLFAPKGSAFLWTRKDRQTMTHALVPSHGYAQGYICEFDYLGTKDWSSYLCAVDGMKFFLKLGADAVREHNNALTRKARQHLLAALPQTEPCPESMLASLASVVLPVTVSVEDALDASMKLHDKLWDTWRIEVPVFPFGSRLLLRVSAQVFNEEHEYEILAARLKEMFAE